jgi:hypothetical protein
MDAKDLVRKQWLEEQNLKRKSDSEVRRLLKQQKIEEVKRREEELLAR